MDYAKYRPSVAPVYREKKAIRDRKVLCETLRQAYRETLEETLPDHLSDLLGQLK